jgi:hypothetical protein
MVAKLLFLSRLHKVAWFLPLVTNVMVAITL